MRYKTIYTKKNLMERDGERSYKGAWHANKKFARSDFAQDYDIVSQREGRVAYYLAKNSPKTGWTTSNERILSLCGGEVRRLLKENSSKLVEGGDLKARLMDSGGKIALNLAKSGDKHFANSKYAQDYDIVSQPGVAFALAYNADKTGWVTNNKKILVLSGGKVAYFSARNSNRTGWVTHDYEILTQYGGWVAQYMAINSPKTGWTTSTTDVLRIRSENERGIVFYVAGTLIDKGKACKSMFTKSNGVVALELAKDGDKYFARSKFAQDYGIVSQRDGEIARELESNSLSTGWKPSVKAIRSLLEDDSAVENGVIDFDAKETKAEEAKVAKVEEYSLNDLIKNNFELAITLAKSGDVAFANSKYAQSVTILCNHNCNASYYLAKNSNITGWKTDNIKILCHHNGWVAYWLARHSIFNGWVTKEYHILKQRDGKVALSLAEGASYTGWATEDKRVLRLCDGAVERVLKEALNS